MTENGKRRKTKSGTNTIEERPVFRVFTDTMSVSYQDSGSGGMGSQYRIPDELQEILLDFTVNYLIEQPSDIAR